MNHSGARFKYTGLSDATIERTTSDHDDRRLVSRLKKARVRGQVCQLFLCILKLPNVH